MATVFPFNKIPTIPLTIISKLLPVFLKQKKIVNKVVGELQQKVDGLSKTATCDDSEINDIKKSLQQIQQLIGNIQRIANLLQPIQNALQTATTIANVLIPIQLAIPAIIGVPEGPKEQTLISLAELLQNITSVLNMLNSIVSMIQDINTQINSIVSLAQQKINSVCNTNSSIVSSTGATNTAADDIAADAAIEQLALFGRPEAVSTSSKKGLSNSSLNSVFNSEFYLDVNVSDDDLQDRLNQIQNLVDEQLNVFDNLIEAPSVVLRGIGIPSEKLGKVGDYYVDTTTQTVYGPKPTQNSWS